MGRKCCVPRCKSGYRSNQTKISLFKVPKENDKLLMWQRKIPRADRDLTSKDHVCELHFQKEFVIREVKTEAYTVRSKKIIKSENKMAIFPCELHSEEILSTCIYFYISMRIKQYYNQQCKNDIKASCNKKKQAKLQNT